MKQWMLGFLLLNCVLVQGQELYVFSDPASNTPAHAVNLKLTDHLIPRDLIYQRFSQRFMPEVMIGINRKWMMKVNMTFGNMHTFRYRTESAGIYLKYRLFSNDELHRHFRIAAFLRGSSTRAPFHYDEISLMGDKSGLEAGLIATELTGHFAISATVSHTQVLDASRYNSVLYIPSRNYQAMSYSVSTGYLLLPKTYRDYKQTNLNVYFELLAQHCLDKRGAYLDAAPAIQLIFASASKLNLGYRTSIFSNMSRMSLHAWQLSFEYLLFNAMPKKKKP